VGWAAFEDAPPYHAAPQTEPPQRPKSPAPGEAATLPQEQPQPQQGGRGRLAASGAAPHRQERSPGGGQAHSPPIDIPAAGGGGYPLGRGEEDPELSEFSSFHFWRSPPAMLADDAEISDLHDGGRSPARHPTAAAAAAHAH
jgi:hypothetical protein